MIGRRPDRGWRDEARLVAGVAFSTTLGHVALITIPMEVGAMVDGLGFDPSLAGMMATVGLMAYALVQIGLAPFGATISPRRIAIVGAALIIGMSFLSALVSDLFLFGAARAVAGIGFGLVFATSNIAGAKSREPERAYAVGLGVSIVFYIALLYIIGSAGSLEHGFTAFRPHMAVFPIIALFGLLLLPTLWFLPTGVDRSARSVDPSDVPPLSVPRAAMGLGLVTIFAVAVFSVYVFLERRAHAVGMSPAETGTMFSAIFAISLLGTGLATLMGRRFGIRLPLTAGLVAQGISCLAVMNAETQVQLWLAAASFCITWYFLYPYLFGICAEIDPAGRLPSAAGAFYLLGSSSAATIGGFILEYFPGPALGYFSLSLCIVAVFVASMVRTNADVAAGAHPARRQDGEDAGRDITGAGGRQWAE